MGIELKSNTVNQVVKGTTMFTCDEAVEYICLILKGRVMLKAKGAVTTLAPGCFIGINDLHLGRYLSDYIAVDELAIFVFSVEHGKTVENILSINKDYGGLMVYSICNFFQHLYTIKKFMHEQAQALYLFIKQKYEVYVRIGKNEGISTITMPQVEELEEYLEKSAEEEYQSGYYLACAKIPLDIQKGYFSFDSVLVNRSMVELSTLISEVLLDCEEQAEYIEHAVYILMNDGEQNLFKNLATLAIRLRKNGKENKELMDQIDEMIDQINLIENMLQEKCGRSLSINRKKMENLYYILLSGEESAQEEEEPEKDISQQLSTLSDSLHQILKYATVAEEQKKEFLLLVEDFRNSSDRMSVDDEMRKKKRSITKLFYDIYESIFLRAFEEKEIPKAVELFLNFGYVDERLLSREQIVFLLNHLAKEQGTNCNIYTLREWLSLVYTGKKEPSKTEFDLEYYDNLRQLKKRGEITEEDEKRLSQSLVDKLRFEIQNMFSYNNRLVNGQLSVFVPILYEEMFLSSAERSYLSKTKLEESFTRIKGVDYSVFCRDILIHDKEKKIEKEYVVRDVSPDMILLPTIGSNGSMWQEVSGKRRDFPGRFLFPIFIESSLDDTMVRMFGRYRWEFCRFIQGTTWNNIQDKSLTSEYMDYIQFYRKNTELSEEKKEKLKLQIQKMRNNSREVFLLDYEAWIKGESKGAIRLNKYVRDILATYCPFAKGIREKIKMQPIFQDAMARYYRNKAKKVHELELRLHALQKNEAEIIPELENTMKFYKDL